MLNDKKDFCKGKSLQLVFTLKTGGKKMCCKKEETFFNKLNTAKAELVVAVKRSRAHCKLFYCLIWTPMFSLPTLGLLPKNATNNEDHILL